MKKAILAGTILTLALLAVASIYFVVNKQTQENQNDISPSAGSTESNEGLRNISKEELAKHNSRNDCWVSYKGRVYDVTAWLPKHPGGVDKIAQFCGSENFETGFNKQHGTSQEGKLYQEATLVGILEM